MVEEIEQETEQDPIPPLPKGFKVVKSDNGGDLPPLPKGYVQKKNPVGTGGGNGTTVGNGNPPSANSTNPFAIGGQYNQPPKYDADKTDVLNTKHDAAIAEQIKTAPKRIPETPILDNVTVKKPISEIDANEQIARHNQHKVDMETAIDNTTLKVLKNKGIVAGKGSPYYEAERKKIEEKTKPTMIGGIVINGAEATYHKDKDGNIGLDRNLGFLESVRKGYNDAVNGEDEANAFSQMDTKQKVEFANKQMQEKPPTEYMQERAGVGELLGGGAPYLVKAAAAAALATAAGVAAPETGGLSMAGAAPVLTVLLTAPDMIKQGAKDEIMSRYMQLKQERPNIPDEELMKIAESGELSGGLLGAANALAYTTSLKLPIAKESKDVLTTYLKGVASSAVHLGGITAGSKAAQLAERKLEGYNVETDKAIDEIVTTFKDNATAGAVLNGLISGAHILPKVIKSAFKYSLKDTPTSEIKTALQANVDAGRIPPEVADQTIADIDGYKAALAKTADGLKPETQASVAGLIQARDNVAAEMATKDPTQRASYEQKIEAYNKQIEQITKTNDPLKYEIDEVTGNPLNAKPTPIAEPTFEDKVRETYPTMKEASDKDINDFAKENAADDPTHFISKFGQEKFDEISKDVPTKTLQDNLDMLNKVESDSPNVEIFKKLIADREEVAVPPHTEQQSGKDGKVAPDAELGIQQGYAKKAMTDFINSPDMGYSIHEEGGKTALGLSEAQVRSANGLKGGDRMQSHEHTNIELTKDEKKQLNKIESDKELGDIDGLEYAKQKRALAKKIFERASNELQQKANEQSGKDVVGELKITDKTKDILDEVSDEKIGEKKYQDFSIDFEDGARAYGKIEDAVADISGINAPKEDGKVVRGSKTYERVLSKLKENGVKTVNIKLQSNDSEAAIKKLVDNGLLTNPRNIMGSSGNEHPVTFDIGSKVNFIEKKNTGTEIEPELGDGRKPVTLSGSTEAERQVAIEQRKKETKQTPMTESRDKLLERIQKYNKLSRSEKRQAYIEANKIKLAVDNFNNTHEQKHSLSTNRDGSLELRNNPTEKRASGKPIKNTLKGNENAIVDNGKPLMERDDNTKKVFNDLLDADVLPVSRRVNGEKMSDAEHEATIQDIMDGIPSQRAENYLNSLEKQIKDDNFDFGNPDKNVRTTLNDALNITVEKGEPMTPDAIEKWLSNESELTPEEQTTFDNIDNLITHYEQLHESENGTPAKVQQPAGKGQESNSGKANENGQPKSETSTANKKEPIKNEEAKANENTNKETGDSTPKPETGEAASATTEGKEGGKKPPPIEPAEPVGEDKPKKDGITHAAVEELRKIIGEPEYEGKPVEDHPTLIAEAQEVIKNNPNAANEVLDKMENGKKVTNKDNAILAIYKATIDAEMAKNPTSELLKRATRLAKTLDVAGTEAGKLLESRKLVGQEDNLTNFLLDKQTAQGTALTEPQIKSESAKYEELKAAKEALEKQLEVEREQHAKDIAEMGLNKAKAKARRESKKSSEDYKKERKDTVEAARKALKDIRNNPQASAAPLFRELTAIAPHVKEYVNSLVSEGVDKLDNIVTAVHAEFKDVLDGLTKRDVLNIMAGDYNEKPKEQTRNEKANTARLLEREAKLLKELERERKGEEKAKTESKKTQSNRRIDELKEKIKEVRKQNKNREADTESPEDMTAGEIEYNAKLQKKLTEKAQKLLQEIRDKKYLEEEPVKPVFKKSRKTQLLEDKVIDLENKIRHERSQDEYNKRGKLEKAFDKTMEVLGVRRLVQSAVDTSVPFRQGATLISPRQIDVWSKGFQANLKSVFNPKHFERIQYEIRHDQQYHDMVKDGITYNDLSSADPNLHNEDFRKSFIYKIPVVREPLLASNRSADAFLNVARFEMYKKMRRNLERKGYTRESDPIAFQKMANHVMNMTGSGKKHAAFDKPAMNKILGNTFYGANLMASRLNLLNPVTYFDPRVPKAVRYEAMKDMVAFTGTMMTVATALAYTTGAKVSLNPDDSDFLQLRYGDKVYDISGGLANYVRTGLRILKAGYTKATGTKHEGNKATDNAGKSVLNFFRNKLSPNTGYGVDAFFGGRYGNDFSPTDIARIYPMYTDDFMKAWKEEGGLLATSTVLLPNILGIGYGSYASKGQIDKNLDDLLQRNMRSDEMNNEKIYNHNAGGRVVTFKEFNEFADLRDKKIEADLKVLYEKGIDGKAYKDLTQEQLVKETNYIKGLASREAKEELFGKDKKTRTEKKETKKLSKEHESNYKGN